MTFWIKLSPKAAHELYHVPLQATQATHNLFLALSPLIGSSGKIDGEWPFVGLIFVEKANPEISVIINNISDELIGEADFNPLNNPDALLFLKDIEIIELLNYFLEYASKFVQFERDQQVQFSLIKEESELQRLRIKIYPETKGIDFMCQLKPSTIILVEILRYLEAEETNKRQFSIGFDVFEASQLLDTKFRPFFDKGSIAISPNELI